MGLQEWVDVVASEEPSPQVDGNVCAKCRAVSCTKCRKKAINHKLWSGFDDFKCSQCGESTVKPSLVVFDPVADNSEKAKLDAISENTPSRKAPEKAGLPDSAIGIPAAIFYFSLTAPITEGREVLLQWIAGGGFMHIIGAIVIGIMTPKLLNK